MPATAVQNALLSLGLCLSAYYVARLSMRLLVQHRDAAIIPYAEPKPQYITQDVEDSLKPSTLSKLLDSPNFSIQDTAATIICDRAVHDEHALDGILYYLAQSKHRTRNQAIQALILITSPCESATIKKINKPKTYVALIKCLEYCVMDYKHNEFDVDWDNSDLRDSVERGCLLILSLLCGYYGAEGLVKGKFIERWLVKEPWGDTTEERQLLFMSILEKRDEHRLNQLLHPLVQDEAGRKQLEEAKLIPFAQRSRNTVVILEDGEDYEGMSLERRRRRTRQNTDEDRLRRRHRNAMVLNDGSHAVNRSDIIER